MQSVRNTADRLAAKRRQDEGFTLIELLVVIVILGVLATVVVFSVGGITNRGDVAACQADRSTVEIAVEAFRAQSLTGVYPATEQAVVDAGLLRALSTKHDVTPNTGAVTAVLPIGLIVHRRAVRPPGNP